MNRYYDSFENPFKNGRIIGAAVKPEDYHRENAPRGSREYVMSRSQLMACAKNPRRWVLGWNQKDTDALEGGNLMDCKVLMPDQFEERFAVCPKEYPDAKGGMSKWTFSANYCKAWRDKNEGKDIVTHDENMRADNAVKFLFGDPGAREFLECSERQVMVMADYEDPETQIVVTLKILIDLLPNKAHPKFGKDIGDYKTAADGSSFAFGRSINKYRYDVQSRLYLDVYSAAVPQERDSFRNIVQETAPPWDVGKRIMGEQFLANGRLKYLAALETYCQCLATNEWLGYERPMPGRTIVDGWLVENPEIWMANDS